MEFSLLERISKPKTKPPEKFLALVISPETVHSAVWQLEDNQAKIVSFGSHEDWSGDQASLIASADASLSAALENISPEPDKLILGLPASWVKGDKITSSKKSLIQQISTKLSLKPVGFVIITEALVNFLKQKEGTPPTAILIQLTETEIEVSLVKLGKIIGSHTVGRSEDLGADVEEGLARFNPSEPLPSRMLLFGGNLDLESARQTLLSYAWQDKLPFLHFPKIELLEANIPVRALTIASSSELTSDLPSPPAEKPDLSQHGFYPGVDVLKSQSPHPPEESPSAFQTKPPQPSPRVSPASASQPSLPKYLSFLLLPQNFSKKLTSLIRFKQPPALALIWLVAVIILGSLTIAAYLLIPTAKVVIYLNPETISQQIDFTVVAGKKTNPEKKRIGGENVTIELKDSLQKETTGEDLVGEKASGEITLFNKTNSVKKFTAGTVLVGPDNLEFSLDEDVSLASQSASDTGITFGSATAKATALQVGDKSNLSSGTSLSVKGFDTSNYAAKVNTTFTGGSSRQVQSVSEADHQSLLEELTSKLEQEASQKLQAQVLPDETILDTDYQLEIVSQKFTKAVGEEADSVGLELELKLTTIKFKTEAVLLLIQQDLKTKIPEGFMSQSSASQLEIKSAEIDDGQAEVEAVLKTKLIPKLDSVAIVNYLKGKYPAATESYLKSLPNFSRVQIELSPKLPQKLATFPRRAQNISLNIQIEEE